MADFPEPVGITTSVSRPSTTASTASRCAGRSENPSASRATESADGGGIGACYPRGRAAKTGVRPRDMSQLCRLCANRGAALAARLGVRTLDRMPRPKREQRPGVHHVTVRGVDRCAMFRGDADRILWSGLYVKALAKYEWESLIYCQMTTHLHLLVKTSHVNLARGMQWLSGTYAQAFNRRHGRDGHLLRGR